MRSIKNTKQQIRRAPYQALAAILVLSVTFFLGNIFALIAIGSQIVLQHFETKPQIIAYLKESVSQEQTASLQTSLMSSNQVEKIRFISKEEALAIYKESVNNDPLLLGSLTDLSTITADVLPASLEISVKNADSFPKVIEILKQSDLVNVNAQGDKDIDFPQDVVAELTAWTKGLRTGGLILIIAQTLSSILTIAMIISMKIRGRRTEIQTLRLLGAKDSFISLPYLYESIFYSLSGAFIGWLFAYISLLYATPFLVQRVSGIIDLPVSPLIMIVILSGSLLTAVLLGLVSGSLAVRRILRTK